jgi:hypothetical protein
MNTTNNKPSAKLEKSINDVANVFNENTTSNYLGCKIRITRKQEPFKYVTNTGKPATKSARYWGYIEYPNGEREEFANARGGAIARLCGIYVREEHEARERATKNGEIWECARKFFRENK